MDAGKAKNPIKMFHMIQCEKQITAIEFFDNTCCKWVQIIYTLALLDR
jgi:hypothetical protein